MNKVAHAVYEENDLDIDNLAIIWDLQTHVPNWHQANSYFYGHTSTFLAKKKSIYG